MDGGKLDWAPEGVYDKAFEKVIKKSEINVISEPFESAFGWHILKVLERREKNITNDIVKDKAYGALFNRKFQEQLQNTLEEIRSEAFVDIKISSPSKTGKDDDTFPFLEEFTIPIIPLPPLLVTRNSLEAVLFPKPFSVIDRINFSFAFNSDFKSYIFSFLFCKFFYSIFLII